MTCDFRQMLQRSPTTGPVHICEAVHLKGMSTSRGIYSLTRFTSYPRPSYLVHQNDFPIWAHCRWLKAVVAGVALLLLLPFFESLVQVWKVFYLGNEHEAKQEYKTGVSDDPEA